MYALLYRWKIRPGHEEAFEQSWERMTRSIYEQCGSCGSRLHRGSDGLWVAYAVWPSRAAHEACRPDDDEAARGMQDAIEERFEPLQLDVVTDLISDPAAPGS